MKASSILQFIFSQGAAAEISKGGVFQRLVHFLKELFKLFTSLSIIFYKREEENAILVKFTPLKVNISGTRCQALSVGAICKKFGDKENILLLLLLLMILHYNKFHDSVAMHQDLKHPQQSPSIFTTSPYFQGTILTRKNRTCKAYQFRLLVYRISLNNRVPSNMPLTTEEVTSDILY